MAVGIFVKLESVSFSFSGSFLNSADNDKLTMWLKR
jgi:hypothetical protein